MLSLLHLQCHLNETHHAPTIQLRVTPPTVQTRELRRQQRMNKTIREREHVAKEIAKKAKAARGLQKLGATEFVNPFRAVAIAPAENEAAGAGVLEAANQAGFMLNGVDVLEPVVPLAERHKIRWTLAKLIDMTIDAAQETYVGKSSDGGSLNLSREISDGGYSGGHRTAGSMTPSGHSSSGGSRLGSLSRGGSGNPLVGAGGTGVLDQPQGVSMGPGTPSKQLKRGYNRSRDGSVATPPNTTPILKSRDNSRAGSRQASSRTLVTFAVDEASIGIAMKSARLTSNPEDDAERGEGDNGLDRHTGTDVDEGDRDDDAFGDGNGDDNRSGSSTADDEAIDIGSSASQIDEEDEEYGHDGGGDGDGREHPVDEHG